jgi:hypothetical protein
VDSALATKDNVRNTAKHSGKNWKATRCNKLRLLAQQSGVPAVKEAMEVINNQITAAVLKAERQVSHKNFGYPWSPKLVEAAWRVTFWRNCLRTVK